MTAQISDEIVLNGELRRLCVLPLAVLFRAMPKPPRFVPGHTANWRGYIATWAIDDERLFLKGLSGRLWAVDPALEPDEETFWWGGKRPDPHTEHASLIAKIEALPVGPGGVRRSDVDWAGWRIGDENGIVGKREASKSRRRSCCSRKRRR